MIPLSFWKSLFILHQTNLSIYSLPAGWRYFSSVCPYVGWFQYIMACHYDQNPQSVTWEATRAFQKSKKQNYFNSIFLTPPLNLLFSPYSLSTYAPNDSSQNCSRHRQFLLYIHQVLRLLILLIESHTLPYLLLQH